MRPRIAVASGTVAVAWTSGSYKTYLAELVGTTWSGTYATPGAETALRLAGVATWAGKSRALTFQSGSALYATTEN